MLKTVNFTNLFALLLLQLFLFGCEKPPTDTIIKAERLIEEAGKAEAGVYASETFLNAENALKTAKKHVSEKEYKEARKSAEEATQFAQEAITLARVAKAKLKEESENMAQEIAGMLSELQACADRQSSKRSKSRTEEIQSLIEQYHSDLSASKGKLQRQELLEAHSELNVLSTQVFKLKEKCLKAGARSGRSWK